MSEHRLEGGGLGPVLLTLLALWVLGRGEGADTRPLATGEPAAVRIADTARRAGFPESSIPKAIDIADCESGLGRNVVGDRHLVDNRWGPSLGPWQIRSRHADRGTGRPRDPIRLLDWDFNAASAYAISKAGRDWSAWSCDR
ncbi:MAG: hypothetical protein ACRDJF_08730 [Actinomycetota bacterium]